jgi:hypothetical protein
MSRKLGVWVAVVGVALSGGPAARGQTGPWRGASTPAPRAALGTPQPIASLDAPVPLPAARPDEQVRRVVARGEAPEVHTVLQGPPPVPPPTTNQVGPLPGTHDYNPGTDYGRPLHHGFTDWCHEHLGGNNGHLFQSCCCADDGLISPLSNPFFFEDPRALTELRPVYIYQSAPHNTPILRGGDTQALALQARLALGENWSIVMPRLGFSWLHAKDPAEDPTGNFRGNASGLSEFIIGPKWTFLRSEQAGGFVAAAGLNFILPVGAAHVFQDTGTLSLDPYVTSAVTFGRTSYGQFDAIGELGYQFGVDDKRSDFFHASLHLDFDVASAHQYYPLLELNWFHYTDHGTAHPYPFEGGDLINFGSSGFSGSRDYLSLALGFRYAFNSHFQGGVYAEFPLATKDLMDWRVGLDLIFRY